ncbi:hypothetical protein ACHAW5_009976 [Stephanodiscus triporus]|uniref:DNA polymerase alpha/delta/epsilon subunit B domain-containing protein n=1 Tax=Stephanodiscus triporus TaxID=2934178 RepID=A0ABD3QDB9_9STRA
MTAAVASSSSSVVVTTRAYAPRVPTYQRFHPNPAPLASSSSSSDHAINGNNGSNANPYARQYSHVYSARLAALRDRCASDALRSARTGGGIVEASANADGEGGNEIDENEIAVAESIIEAREGSWTILVGTIVREMSSRSRRPPPVGCGGGRHDDAGIAPDAYSFLFPPRVGAVEPPRESSGTIASSAVAFDRRSGDVVHLEDESGRVVLESMEEEEEEEGDAGGRGEDEERGGGGEGRGFTSPFRPLDPNSLVTGVVVAVVGKVDGARGVVRVRSVHLAGPPPRSNSSPTTSPSSSSTRRPRASEEDPSLRGAVVVGGKGGVGAGGRRRVDDDDNDDDGPILLLVSGLGCGSDSPTDLVDGSSLAMRREMLLEYLTNPDLSDGASICRVIVAGGGVASPIETRGDDDNDNDIDDDDVAGAGSGISNGKNSKRRRRDYNTLAASESSSRKSRTNDAADRVARSLRELDLYLSEMLASGIPVDYVPGWHDPTNANWPQRPLHPCLLPSSCTYVDIFGRGTNPYECGDGGGGGGGEGGGVRVLGSDGLNVADLRRFLATRVVATTTAADDDDVDPDAGVVVVPSSIDALHRTLVYGHVAPTGPDSLPTFPSCECDPFVMSRAPDVYFAGNCDRFETRLVDGRGEEIEGGGAAVDDCAGGATRLVCVPSFALTGEVVLVKLRSLESIAARRKARRKAKRAAMAQQQDDHGGKLQQQQQQQQQ